MSGIDVATDQEARGERAAGEAPQLHAGALYPSPLAAGTRLQEFEISAVIGQGGFGIVYLARDLSLQRSVAIKEYMPAHMAGRDAEGLVRPLLASQAEVFELGRRSFINEARMLARFKHPGLLEVLRFWQQNGTAYMAMPYYDGATLTQYLKRHPKVATEEWLKKTLSPLVDALGHMHREDCFHRDVAPDNILILKDGSAVLLDLGAARRVIANDVQAMTVMLKPGYAPIEQYSDDPQFRQGPWTDIYAMAAVFFFAITGKPPPASASRVMRDSVSPLSSLRPTGYSDSFLKAIDQGLSLQPEDRPRSIAAFRSMLHAAPPPQGRSQPAAARKPEHGPAHANGAAAADAPFAAPAPSRGPVAAVLAVIAAAALVTGGAWYGMQPGIASDAPTADESTANASVTSVAVVGASTAGAAKASMAVAVKSPVAAAVKSPTADPMTAPVLDEAAAGFAAPDAAVSKTTPTPTQQVAAVPAAAATPTVPTTRPARPGATAEDEARPAATANGTVVLAVKPWAEVRVDGVARGHTPPMKQLTLPAGRHTIELRNPASAPVTKQIEVRANQKTVISQSF